MTGFLSTIPCLLHPSTGATTNGSIAAIAGTTAGGNNSFFVNYTAVATQNNWIWFGGLYSTLASAGDMFICNRTGAGNYTIYSKIAYSHGGTGFEYFRLPSPVFAFSASFCIGLFSTSGSWSFDQTTQNRGNQATEPTVGSSITGLAEVTNAIFIGAFKY